MKSSSATSKTSATPEVLPFLPTAKAGGFPGGSRVKPQASTRYRSGMADLTERTRTVLAHMLGDPNGSHFAGSVVSATGLPAHHVYSVFALLRAQGWAVDRDLGGPHKALTLTSIGRAKAAELVELGDVGVPLAQVDRDDPVLADRVRAMFGWDPKHA